ncbi:toprim domain-containing protein [Algoriphagus sp. AGSA1]|uniref:toprim domain-containing protein n=1 Tax=Algoriphagus sp. AGSA1 TaxID=2907213 RepID=UPI001F17B827|nr:toprim domain-containing protein [Algoriphagus sp. AGSA1]MCE7056879.1 toprim domain-containing protein [Algoriphagus sp. AGSA1]
MDIEKAKSIPLSAILEKLGLSVKKQTQKEAWYLSPFRDEKTPSFHVDLSKNIWFDFGENRGGDSIKFVCDYLESGGYDFTVSDALRWLRNMVEGTADFQPSPAIKNIDENPKLVLKDVHPLRHAALIHYIKSRGIPPKFAHKYVREVSAYHTEKKKTYFSIGFPNEENGYELRNPFFKGCIRPKYISFIRGTVTKPKGIHIFEGFMDYLSVITQRKGKPLSNDTIVLNSLTCIGQAKAYIKGYGYAVGFTWFDNDKAGEKAAKAFNEFFKSEGIILKPKNDIYAPHKDVNAWHMHTLGLGL